MLNLFYMGGPLFMGILTLIFLAMVIVAGIQFIAIAKSEIIDPETISRKLGMIRSIGLFAMIVGILGQLIGLFDAFKAMEKMQGGISPALLSGGLKISMISTLYGITIFLISMIIWFIATWRFSR